MLRSQNNGDGDMEHTCAIDRMRCIQLRDFCDIMEMEFHTRFY